MMDMQHFFTKYSDFISIDAGPPPALTILDEGFVREKAVDRLVVAAVFGTNQHKRLARWAIWEIASALGIYPDTVHPLYAARAAGVILPDFTVPAINLRAMAYEMARAVFAAAMQRRANAMLFELTRAESSYTQQSVSEYIAVVLAAAIRQGYVGPVYFQVDRIEVDGTRFATNARDEISAIKRFIKDAIAAGFYNFDLDTSTLVRSGDKPPHKQMVQSYRLSAELTDYIRAHQPAGIDAAVSARIGSLRGSSTTEDELRVFMDGYLGHLSGDEGLCKLGVHAGTKIGGVALPDGTIANVDIDFATLLHLSTIARNEYRLAGVIQYGTSTLPQNVFHKFVECETVEVHMATRFQNMLYEHQAFPPDLRLAMYHYLDEHYAQERPAGMTDEQFYYHMRKYAIGPFKAELWGLDEQTRAQIRDSWENQIGYLFDQLNIADTCSITDQYVQGRTRSRHIDDFAVD